MEPSSCGQSHGLAWRLVFCAAALSLASAGSTAVAQGKPSQASQGDANAALVAKALAFEHGEGVPKDPMTALALYCVAARAGSAEAQYNLGWMFANGRGVGRPLL